jgi:membrane-bound serine protease (ClpP class)
VRTLLAALATLFAVVGLVVAARPSAAAPTPGVHVDVVQVGGLLDPVNVDLVRRAVREAPRRGTDLILVQLDSSDASVKASSLDALAFAITASPVPVATWVGPAGSGHAVGDAFVLLRAADVRGAAPGAKVGREPSPVFSTTPAPLRNRVVGAEEAKALGVVDVVSPTLADFLGQLDGRAVKGRTISTAKSQSPFVLRDDLDVRFRKPGLTDRALHALGSPSATLFLLVGGLLLIVFELYSAGVGIAAASGATCLALAAYGVGTLHATPLGLGMLLLATVGFAIDVQAGSPRFWTGVGTIALVVGSLTLFDGHRAGWLALLLIIVGALVFVLFGIPSTVRTRFSTPTIGRDDLVGAAGTASTDLDPEGTVEVRGAPWRARTFPKAIKAGDAIEVVAIEGLVLDVVPAGTELLPPRHAPS